MTEILFGRPVADSMSEKILQSTADLPLKLVTLGFSQPQWLQYSNSVQKSSEKFGVAVENILADGLSSTDFCKMTARISRRSDVDGVLLQQPLIGEFANAVNFVDTKKDVDCLNPLSVAKLYLGQSYLPPATPSAVLHLLDFYNIDLTGKNVTIVGRGNAVGKPLALMMLKRNATVTVCHTKTVDLPSVCKKADIIVSACGVAGLIDKNCVTKKSIVIDVGLSFVDGKTCGDVAKEVYEIAQAVSPVPGGVGPITRMALFENLLSARKECQQNS